MLAKILIAVSVGAFILSRIARSKSQSILVSYDVTVEEETIKSLGLYAGLPLQLRCADTKDKVNIFATNAAGQEVLLGSFISPIEYDILRKKNINAFVYAVNGNLVTVEVKLNDAL